MEVKEEQLNVTEQLNCKLTKHHVPIGVIVKKEDKLGGKMIGDSWKIVNIQLWLEVAQLHQ